WVLEQTATLPGFSGALYHGSTVGLPGNSTLPATSDVDILIVLNGPIPPVKPGKIRYRDVLLDVSYLPLDQVRSPEQVLGNAHVAGSFRKPSVISDPTGQLAALQARVARDFANRKWVRARCEHARDKILRNLESLQNPAPLHDHVTAWLFATGVTTHVLLVAGLKNPTVRRRYVDTRELLVDYGRADFQETLLDLLGCARMSQSRAEQHLAALADVFDAAKSVLKTPFFFASDISDGARPVAVDGSRALIERGLHREAIFWILAMYSRCQKVLYHDAPVALQERFRPGYHDLLSDLGITSPADLQQRGERVNQFLPRLQEVAEAIMATNPGIENEPETSFP
ncbi:MAG TPA: hypothetical protein VFG50_07465, partial [Rhodothermales bacterium]|nr:hypothetical protein [Rhodothermales bacterium]